MLKMTHARRPHFSLRTLLIGLALAALVFAGAERLTYGRVSQGHHTTRLIPVEHALLAPRLHDWMTASGFRRTTSVPSEFQGKDNFGNPYGNFYVGSYQGSAPFYVSVNPNWDNDESRGTATMSNVLLYAAVNFTGRVWDVKKTKNKFGQFIDDFHSWCDDVGPPAR